MTSRSRLVLASSVIAVILLAGCGSNSTASGGNAGRSGAGQVGHVRAVQAVVSRKPSLEVQRLDTRGRVVESLIAAADLAGRNDWRAFDRAIADARRAIHRYRQSIGGDVAALNDVETLALTVDHVIALASYTGTDPDIDYETDADEDAETDAVVYLGSGVDIPALTNAVTDSIAAAAKISLPMENPQR
jgi:hypothetical protein